MEQALLASVCGLAVAVSHSQVFKKPKQLIVHTSSGIPNVDKPPLPPNPCSKCKGTGKITCGNCNGVGTHILVWLPACMPQLAQPGRVNYTTHAVLPKGVFPKWCAFCRSSGRWYCERCMGTGVHRDPIGFRLH